MLIGLLLACVLATVIVMATSSMLLGMSRRVFLEDLVMVALTQATTSLVLAMPLAWPRSIAANYDGWSMVIGTSLSLIGIVLNHLALRSVASQKEAADSP